MGSPRARIRLPAGGQAEQAVSIFAGPVGGDTDKNAIPCKEYSIVDDMLNVADSFACTIANTDGENAGRVQVGQRIEVDESDPAVVGGQWCRTFTGRVVGVRYSSDASGGSVIRIAAMDLGWHLTSCCAKVHTQMEGVRLGELLRRLIHPTWGFATTKGDGGVIIGNALNRRVKQGREGVVRAQPDRSPLEVLPYIQIEPGMVPWDVIKTYVEREGFLLNVGSEGELILFTPNYAQDSVYDCIHYHPTGSRLAQQNNVFKTPSLDTKIDGLFTTSECWSTVVRPQIADENTSINPNANCRSYLYAPGDNPLPFDRLGVVNDGEAINETMRKNRAVRHYQMGQFDSWEYSVELPQHSSAGVRFVSDTMIPVEDEINGPLSGMYYVQRVQRSVTLQGGTNAALTIKLPKKIDPSLNAQVGGGAVKPSRPQPSRR